jgi:two-component system cell cycle sensor histidine kinase/response regulator CckA
MRPGQIPQRRGVSRDQCDFFRPAPALELSLTASGDRPVADEGMIEQVLLNLVVNSRDAMPRGGRLTLTAGTAEPDEEYRRRVPQALSGHYIYLAVADTGTGIAPEILSRIFDPFFTTKDVGKGTRLGLATVYAVAQQHKGWIEVDSTVGQGTTFRVYFPCLEQTGTAADSRLAAGRLTPGSETILVVGDNELVRASTCRILQRAGYQVHEASSGEAALKVWAMHQERIDLIVTDVIMQGGMTGRDLVERLREDRLELKAIYTSGYSSDILGRDFLRTAANCFLAKPFEPTELTRLVRECLQPE